VFLQFDFGILTLVADSQDRHRLEKPTLGPLTLS